jgi:hypothetical protein
MISARRLSDTTVVGAAFLGAGSESSRRGQAGGQPETTFLKEESLNAIHGHRS